MPTPPFTLGIEEEYLLLDADSYELAEAPEALIDDCKDVLQGQVSPEFLRCQVEIGTAVCATVPQARDELRKLRACVAEVSARHGLVPIAAACHPSADWVDQSHRDRNRYNSLLQDLAGVAERMLVCGMHVHVGLDDDELRIDLMNQLTYFLPHVLALSGSSPFWQGRDTGLASYRLSVFDNLPRTGLPPRFESFGAYQRTTAVIVDSGLIEDSSKIWWDLRPSDHYPTLETRICDVQPRVAHAVSLAALLQCLTRFLWRMRTGNRSWRLYDNFLIEENRWRAQRYGTTEGLIDFSSGTVTPMAGVLDELVELVAPDAEALGCTAEIEGLHDILRGGTSSERQRATHTAALKAGADDDGAMRAVLAGLVEEFTADL